MRGRRFAKVVVTCGMLMVWCIAAHEAQAQLRGALRGYPAPMPAQPAPDVAPQSPQVNPPPQAPAASPAPASGGEQGTALQMQTGDRHRLIRGRELIGMTVWGPHQQRLGTVKDFIVDNQAGCPTLFFAMAPEIPGWNGDYVIVPFDAFQLGYDERQRMDYFTLGVAIDNLRRAPHLGIDRWGSLHDPQFFADSRQFYRRVERTAARPGDVDASREPRRGDDREIRQPLQRQGEANAPGRTQSRSATGPDTQQREPDAARQPQLSPPARSAEPASREDQRPSGTVPDTRRESDAGKQTPAVPPASRSDAGTSKPKSTTER